MLIEDEANLDSSEPTELQSPLDELQTLFDTSNQVVRQRDLMTALIEILKGLQKLVPYDSGTVHYHRAGDEWLEPLLTRSDYPDLPPRTKISYAHSILGRTLLKREFYNVNNVADDPESFFKPEVDLPERLAQMSAPLLVEQGDGWVLSIRRIKGKTFSEREFLLFQIFASYAETAVENARLYEVALRETEALRRVNIIMRSADASKTAEQLYTRIAQEIGMVIEYEQMTILEIEREKDLIKLVFNSNQHHSLG